MYLCAQLWQQVEGGAVSSLTRIQAVAALIPSIDYGLSLNEKKKAGGERNNQQLSANPASPSSYHLPSSSSSISNTQLCHLTPLLMPSLSENPSISVALLSYQWYPNLRSLQAHPLFQTRNPHFQLCPWTVSQDCHHKAQQMDGLTEMHCLPALEARSLRSRCQQGWVLPSL